MPTISQLPLATDVAGTDELPLSQGGVARAVPVSTLLEGLQPEITLPHGALLGRVSNGPGGPETVAIGTGLLIENDVLTVDHSAFQQIGTLATGSNVILNDINGTPSLMPLLLLRGLYKSGQNVTIDPDGTIHSTPVAATGASIGAVAVGNGLVINASGQLSVNVGNVPGTIAAGDDPRIVGAQQVSQKGLANGYAALDASGLVPPSQLPVGGGGSGVSSIDGRTGNITLTTADIGGLGSIATQSAGAVAITGGSVVGATASAATATASFAPAVPRTLAAHFSDVLNINDFGLARNGTTDDSVKFVAACQAAMAAKLKLYIPAGGPILLSDAAQVKLANISIFGDGLRDYDSPSGYGYYGSVLWFVGTTKSPFLIAQSVHFEGLTFFWPNQTETATVANNNLPIVYPPLFAQQSPAANIVYFNFIDCQVTNCYDFFTQSSTAAVVGACSIERSIIYAINTCFTLQLVPEVFFIANCLFTFGVYGSVVSVGPTYNLRTFTNTQGTWMKVVGNGTPSQSSSSVVGGIISNGNYIYGCFRGLWLAAGTLDISSFVNTSFDTVPNVILGDPGCGIYSTRFTGGAWYPIYFASGNPDTTAITITNPAPSSSNVSFSGITIPFIDGSLATITGSNISMLSFSDIRCPNIGHTAGGTGPYHGLQFNTPNANLRVQACDFTPSNGGLQNTGVQIAACAFATINHCYFYNFAAPIDIETTSGVITLSGNTTVATQNTISVIGVGAGNVHDLFNTWDKPTYAYNGFAPGNYRAGATIGIQPVSSTTAGSYVGVQPSALGGVGGTRLGLTAAGNSVVSLMTNNFTEEQLRANRLAGAVNYVAVRGALSGAASLVTTGGADAAGSLQVSGNGLGATLLGTQGASGSPVVHLGATADQSYFGFAPANGFTILIPSNSSTALLKPAGTLATGTIILPTAVVDGEKIEIWTSKTITSLTVTGQSGTIVNNGSNFQLVANASVGFFWNAPNNTWFQRLGGGSANGTIAQQDASNVAITGGSITGLATLAVGTNAAIAASLYLDTAAGFGRQIVYQSGGLPRWVVGAQGTPENMVATTAAAAIAAGATNLPLGSTAGLSTGMLVGATGIATGTTITAVNGDGSITLSQAATGTVANGAAVTLYTNQGSDFAVLPYDDTGAPLAPTLGQPLVITRATGQVTIKSLAIAGSAYAPTPTAGDFSTQVATTAFVANNAVAITRIGAASGVASLDGTSRLPTAQLPVTGNFTTLSASGSAIVPTLAAGDSSANAASTAWVKGLAYAPLASPALSGTPTAPTATTGDNSTRIATTAFVSAAAAAGGSVSSVFGRAGSVVAGSGDYTVGQVTGAAPLASPALTGTPSAPTPAGSDNSTTLATTAYVTTAAGALLARSDNLASLASATTARGNLGLGTLAVQAASAAAVTGGTIDGTTIGATTPAAVIATTLAASTSLGLGTATGAGFTQTINGTAASVRQIVYQTAGSARWVLLGQADGEAATVTLNTNAASASIMLSFAAVSGVVVGMTVGGTGVAAGTFVTAFTATTVTISIAASVASGAAIKFYPNAGSSFTLRGYDDGGNLLFAPLACARGYGGALTLATNGYGPIVVQGGGSVAGNTRGVGAFDGQQTRTAATQIASGASSTAFGSNNTASGANSFAAGNTNAATVSGAAAVGNNNTVSGTGGFISGANNTAYGTYAVVGGYQATDRGRYGTSTFASGDGSVAGDTQTAFGLLRASSTVSAAARLTADGAAAGSANVWNIPNNTACKLRIELLGWNASGVQVAGYTAACKLVRGAGAATTRLTSTALAADADNDSITGLTAPALAADTTNGGLIVTSGFSTAATMRWAARVISAVELQ